MDATLPADAALYEDAACGLLLTDTAGLVLRANATVCGWLGFSQDELVGQMRIQERLPIGARLFHQTHCTPILQMQGSLAELQIDMLDRAGVRVPMLVNIQRRRRGDGDDARVVDEWALFVVRTAAPTSANCWRRARAPSAPCRPSWKPSSSCVH
ncbi:PAS domain-containing protein [Massilia sp. Dwa41.01b]|uniref:PAS domain-containing protein n=1 Tax=Massilia sp. Dwa41.01b TaxID=2709302 RepID=UPI002805874D|nr:PAS domain-containing protein [Massilia sp. Dwa41.01b]